MNILLSILQVLLALHTLMGAVWKFSNPEQSAASLGALPHGLWLLLSGVEIACAFALVLSLASKRFGRGAPIAAAVIAGEMLLFCGVQLASGDANRGPVIYWLVVAAFCAFIAWGRWRHRPVALVIAATGSPAPQK